MFGIYIWNKLSDSRTFEQTKRRSCVIFLKNYKATALTIGWIVLEVVTKPVFAHIIHGIGSNSYKLHKNYTISNQNTVFQYRTKLISAAMRLCVY